MAIFHVLLKRMVDESGVSLRGIALAAKVDRPTLSKILSGERLPSETYLNNLIRVLKVSESEKIRLIGEYEKIHWGEGAVHRMNGVKKLIEDLHYFRELGSAASRINVSGNFIEETRRHTGQIGVRSALKELLYSGCGDKEEEEIYLSPDFPQELVQLLVGEAAVLLGTRLCVKQVLRFAKAGHDPESVQRNIDLLARVIPASVCDNLEYRARCFYENVDFSQDQAAILPCSAVVGEYLMLLSKDGKTAFTLRDKALSEYYREQLSYIFQMGRPLLVGYKGLAEIVRVYLEKDSNEGERSQISPQPCLVQYISPDMAAKVLYPEIVADKAVMELVEKRLNQLRGYKSYHKTVFFSEEGIALLADEGRISDIPSSLYRPLNLEERLNILLALRESCAKLPECYKVLRPQDLKISTEVSLAISPDGGVFITLSKEDLFQHIEIMEDTVSGAFCEFAAHLTRLGMIQGAEDCINIVDKYIDKVRGAL